MHLFAGTPGKIGLGIRYILLKSTAKAVGDNVYIGRWVVLKSPHQLSVGDNVSIHEFCYFDAAAGINIGSDVSVAHNVSIISFEHTWSNPHLPIKYNELAPRPISIANDVWLGCGVRVLAGTSIESRVVVGAGSVVRGHLSESALYAGVPARRIKQL